METRTILLGGGLANMQIPAAYLAEEQESGTWQIFPPDQEDITLRVSTISVRSKSDPDKNDCMVEEIERRAEELDLELVWLDDLRCYYQRADRPGEEGGDALVFKYWDMGYENSMFILSATILQKSINAPHVLECIKQVAPMLESIIFAPFDHRERIETPYGSVESKVRTEDKPPEQQIEPFAEKDNEWLQRQLHLAERLIASYSREPVADVFDPKNLDFVFAKWLADKSPDRTNGDFIAEAMGAAFGEYLCRAHGMKWVMVTDEFGTACAVRHPGSGNYMAFVVESVLKRVESRETDFFWNISQMLKHNIECQESGGA